MHVIHTAEREGKVIPDHVLADRDRRAKLEHASLTARHCGDPLPGCSALDAAPSLVPDPLLAIKRDPLDYLIFRRRNGRPTGKVGGVRYG